MNKVTKVTTEEANQEIRDFFTGRLPECWELTQEEARWVASLRCYPRHWSQTKSRAALWMAAEAVNTGTGDLYLLLERYAAYRRIRKALPLAERKTLGIHPEYLLRLGLTQPQQIRRFAALYKEVKNDFPWGDWRQVNVRSLADLVRRQGYERLPLWVKRRLVMAPTTANIGGDRPGNIWRLVPCAKAWRWAPLPKRLAEKVGGCSPRMRMLAAIAWGPYQYSGLTVDQFWQRLADLAKLPLMEQCRAGLQRMPWGRSQWQVFVELSLGLPYGTVRLPKLPTISDLEDAIILNASPRHACRALLGVAGSATTKAFVQCKDRTLLRWAQALAFGDPNAIQKILCLEATIEWEPEAAPFLQSLPVSAQLRLLQATTYKHRGQVHTVSRQLVRDVGYFWANIAQKPDLGRVRCWFSIHETLAAAFIKDLPDEPLPIPEGWEPLDGLCAADGSWELEFPRRVATLKLWGEILQNCVGGYGSAILSGRSVVFCVRQSGQITHCVEIANGAVEQFCRDKNLPANPDLRASVIAALKQARKI